MSSPNIASAKIHLQDLVNSKKAQSLRVPHELEACRSRSGQFWEGCSSCVRPKR